MTWRRLQRELERRSAALSTSRRSEDDRRSEAVERSKISGGQNESEMRRVDEPSRPHWTLKKKRKRGDEGKEEERTTAEQDYNIVENGEKEKTPERGIGTGLDLDGKNLSSFYFVSKFTLLHFFLFVSSLFPSISCERSRVL